MSNEFVFSGVEELDNITGGWKRGSSYLVSGASGTGKSVFMMQLIKRIMAEEEKVVLITSQDPQVFLNHANDLELRMDSYVANNDLVIIKQVTQSSAVIRDSEEFTRFLTDFGNNVIPVEASAIIFDPFIPIIQLFSDEYIQEGITSLIFELKQMGLTSFLTTKMPTSRKALMIRKFIEDRVNGSIHLDEHLKENEQVSRKMIIRKMDGLTSPYPVFRFQISSGIGLEITERSNTDLQVHKKKKDSKLNEIQSTKNAPSFSFLNTMKKEQESQSIDNTPSFSKSTKKANPKLSFKEQYKDQERKEDQKNGGRLTFTDKYKDLSTSNDQKTSRDSDKEGPKKQPERKISFSDKSD